MKVKERKLLNVVLIVLLIILVILLLLAFSGATSLSKHKRTVNSESIAQIAKPIFVVDGDKNIKVDGIEDTIYHFTVKNYNSTEISDVDLKYNIEIVNTSEADLVFELTNADNEIIPLTSNKTGLLELNNNTATGRNSEEYNLRIKYKNNPAIISDIQGNIQVKVEAVQSEVV